MRDFYNKIPELLNMKIVEEKLQKSQKEEGLENGKEKARKKLEVGYNKVFFVELDSGEKGIFKPKNGERELSIEIEAGSYYKRERAVYLVDRFFDFNLVPATVIREINGEIGSFQEFIPDTVFGYEDFEKLKINKELEKELMKMWILDLIIWSCDRHWLNFLIKRNKIYAIDNGLSFGKDALLTYGSYFNKPMPEEITDKFKKFFEKKDENEKILKIALKDLLSEEEIGACVKRINKIGNLVLNNKVISKKDNLTFN